MSVTIYRHKTIKGEFRVVAGSHAPLSADTYTRSNYDNAGDAFETASERERSALMLIDPHAERLSGHWARIDKGDGIETAVSREEVFNVLHAAKVCKTGAELRRRIAQAEAARAGDTVSRLETRYGRYVFRAVEGSNNG